MLLTQDLTAAFRLAIKQTLCSILKIGDATSDNDMACRCCSGLGDGRSGEESRDDSNVLHEDVRSKEGCCFEERVTVK
jgi:hypothetical protein